MSRKKQTNKQTKQYKKIVKLSYLHYLSEVCVSFFFLRASHFLSPWGWGEGFLGEHMARGGTRGGRISCRQKSIERDYRKLTADGEGGRGRMMRILESLIGEIR